ncbi:hypothetical protein ACRAWG_20210 [Methylobacterium sp. P31]
MDRPTVIHAVHPAQPDRRGGRTARACSGWADAAVASGWARPRLPLDYMSPTITLKFIAAIHLPTAG